MVPELGHCLGLAQQLDDRVPLAHVCFLYNHVCFLYNHVTLCQSCAYVHCCCPEGQVRSLGAGGKGLMWVMPGPTALALQAPG